MKKNIGLINIVVIIITIILFIVSLYTTGFTHDLFLEAGILLVSIKLIMMSYKNNLSNEELLNKIKELSDKIDKLKKD